MSGKQRRRLEQQRAQQQAQQQPPAQPQNTPVPATSAPEIDTRTFANRANAQLSTGPRTLTGKEISKLNAVRHGLTGGPILLPTEDADRYTALVERFRSDHQPVSERERELVQMMIDTQWRLNRIPRLESAIFALGQMRYADLFPEIEPASLRREVIELHTTREHAKELRNLSLQEGRLQRQYNRHLKELKALQAERKKQEEGLLPAEDGEMEVINPNVPMPAITEGSRGWVRYFKEKYGRDLDAEQDAEFAAKAQRAIGARLARDTKAQAAGESAA